MIAFETPQEHLVRLIAAISHALAIADEGSQTVVGAHLAGCLEVAKMAQTADE